MLTGGLSGFSLLHGDVGGYVTRPSRHDGRPETWRSRGGSGDTCDLRLSAGIGRVVALEEPVDRFVEQSRHIRVMAECDHLPGTFLEQGMKDPRGMLARHRVGGFGSHPGARVVLRNHRRNGRFGCCRCLLGALVRGERLFRAVGNSGAGRDDPDPGSGVTTTGAAGVVAPTASEIEMVAPLICGNCAGTKEAGAAEAETPGESTSVMVTAGAGATVALFGSATLRGFLPRVGASAGICCSAAAPVAADNGTGVVCLVPGLAVPVAAPGPPCASRAAALSGWFGTPLAISSSTFGRLATRVSARSGVNSGGVSTARPVAW